MRHLFARLLAYPRSRDSISDGENQIIKYSGAAVLQLDIASILRTRL